MPVEKLVNNLEGVFKGFFYRSVLSLNLLNVQLYYLHPEECSKFVGSKEKVRIEINLYGSLQSAIKRLNNYFKFSQMVLFDNSELCTLV